MVPSQEGYLYISRIDSVAIDCREHGHGHAAAVDKAPAVAARNDALRCSKESCAKGAAVPAEPGPSVDPLVPEVVEVVSARQDL